MLMGADASDGVNTELDSGKPDAELHTPPLDV